MKLPPPLHKGDTIGVMAPSSRIAPADLQASTDFLTAKGYNVFVHPQCFETLHQSAGSTDQKVSALHDLVKEPNIRAVFFATGGNRALHILDHLDYKLIKKNPKIYMGFSDNTAILSAITARCDLITYHGPTFRRLPSNPQVDFNLRLLSGEEKTIPLNGAKVIRDGTATGPLIGGNLALFRSLIGSKDMPDAKGAILFLEDVGEELSRIDRDLCMLRRAGVFDKLGGLVLGQFSDLKDSGTPFGFSFEEIITEHTADLNIPVIMDAPFGHGQDLVTFPIGAKAKLDGTMLMLV